MLVRSFIMPRMPVALIRVQQRARSSWTRSIPKHIIGWCDGASMSIALIDTCRRATCYLQTLKYKQAIADFKKVLALEPNNALVRQQLDSTQKIMRKAEFEKAIEMEEEASPVERCMAIIAEGEFEVRLQLPCLLNG